MNRREQFIRDRQNFVARLGDLIELASALTDSELEIALARMADSLDHANKAASASTATLDALRFKGEVVHSYFSLRREGSAKVDQKSRRKMEREMAPGAHASNVLISKVVTFKLPPVPILDFETEYMNPVLKNVLMRVGGKGGISEK